MADALTRVELMQVLIALDSRVVQLRGWIDEPMPSGFDVETNRAQLEASEAALIKLEVLAGFK